MAPRKRNETSNFLSQEYIVESDSDDIGQDPESSKAASRASSHSEETNNGVSTASSEQSPSVREDSENANESESNSGSSSSEEDEQESSKGVIDSVAELESVKEKRPREQNDEESPRPQKRAKITQLPDTSVPKKDFKPPAGFQLSASVSEDALAHSKQLFSDLQSKQVWHITAPSSLDITSVQQLDIESAMQGDPIQTDKGDSYGMHASRETGEILLLPQSSSRYKRSTAAIARSFSLQKSTTETDGHAADAANSSSSTLPAISFTAKRSGLKKEPRQQPEGLRMRYVPFGVYDKVQRIAVTNGVNQETEDVLPETPKSSKHRKSKKQSSRNHDLERTPSAEPMDVDVAAVESSAKKKKSKKTLEDGSPAEKKKKKKKKPGLIDVPGL